MRKSEAALAMALVVKSVPYSFGNTANRLFPLMFADSQVAKKIGCGRKKLPYMVFDGLAPYFMAKK